MAVKNDFKTLYYRTANCLTSDIIADMNPASRVLGVDTTAGFGTVFTAMGSRFDIRFVAKEAFLATENYECDTRSVDHVSVDEVMRYVRAQTIAEDTLPEAYRPFVETVKKGESVYRQYHPVEIGSDGADVLFLMSPAQRASTIRRSTTSAAANSMILPTLAVGTSCPSQVPLV